MSPESIGLAAMTGASLGIGAIYAERLVRRGFDLLVAARNRDRIATTGFRQIEEGCYEMRVGQFG